MGRRINATRSLWRSRYLLTGNPQITFFKVVSEDTPTFQWNALNKLSTALLEQVPQQ